MAFSSPGCVRRGKGEYVLTFCGVCPIPRRTHPPETDNTTRCCCTFFSSYSISVLHVFDSFLLANVVPVQVLQRLNLALYYPLFLLRCVACSPLMLNFFREALTWFCDRHGFAGWFETSAKQNINIDEASRFLVSKVLERMPDAGTPTSRLGMKVRDLYC